MQWLDRLALPKGGRVLDVGCGAGGAAKALRGRGFAVTAIDASEKAIAEARANGVEATLADFVTFEGAGGPFDVVYFGRSLHHVASLDAAVARAAALLAKGGRVVCEEFAFETANETSAVWHYGTMDALEAAGAIEPKDRHHDDARLAPLDRWRHTFHAHGVHDGAALERALRSRFTLETFERTEYFFRIACHRLRPDDRGGAIAERALAFERACIAEGSIPAVGLRIVAR